MPVVGDEPAGGFREEGRAAEDDAREDELQPDGDAPGLRAGDVACAVRDEGSGDAADIPECVEYAGADAAVGRMGHFRYIGWAGGRCDGDTETQNKTTAHEATKVDTCCLNTSTDNDNRSAYKHTPFSSSEIRSWARYKRADKVANRINGVNYSSSRRTLIDIEAKIRAVLVVAVDCAHERSIVPVDARVERGDKEAKIQLNVIS